MAYDAILEKYLTPGALDAVAGRAPEKVEKWRAEFRKDGLTVVRGCMSEAGLEAVRKHLDALGRDFDMQTMGKRHEEIVKTCGRHVMQDPFVRALMEDPRFSAFLSSVTGRSRIKIRKANAAIYSRGGGVTPPWHFDGPRVSLVIPIDAPPEGAGGEYAYFPMMRRRGEPSWLRALRGVALRLGLHRAFVKPRIIPYEAGSILLFDGDTTYHRAMSMTKDALRRSLLFFFDDEFTPEKGGDMMM
jgi:ectoine hydroxylase-related dioxygenase (phytanoyl-CoA dioxygenase family)